MGSENSNRIRKISLRLTTAEFMKVERKWKASTCRKLCDYVRHNLFEKPVTSYYRNQSLDDFMAEMVLLRNETGSFYIVDKGYIDFNRLYRLHLKGSFFVTRAKDNMRFKRMYSRAVDKTTGVLYDQIGRLETYYSRKDYPEKLRRIKYYDQNRDRTFIFMTNNTDLKAEEIAMLYKKRWEVELFFKWMKQHLRIKSFWGITMNAVKVQIYCAIIAYCLVAIVGNKLKVDRSIYEILQILSISLLDKTPVKEILTKCDYKNVKELNYKQLTISGF